MPRRRLVIADDNEAIRYLLKALTKPDCDIVGEAENGQEAILAAQELLPDVLIMDVSMPVMNGFEATRILKKTMPELRIILTSQHDEQVYVDEAFRLGINGY